MLSMDESPGRTGPATSADVLPNSLRQDGVRFCREQSTPRPVHTGIWQT